MQDKVCLVTGATAGVGLEVVLGLAREGATVVGVGRNPAKNRAVCEQIRQKSGNPRVFYLLADLSSQAAVQELAAAVVAGYPRLDLLVNNAGGYFARPEVSVDGIELTFALNHLNYFLLTHLLLERLQASAPARVINVASDAHQRGRIDFTALEGQQPYSGWRAYSQSKLANVLHAAELARRLEGRGVTANSLHPGFVASDFALNNLQGGWRRFIGPYRLLQKLIAVTPAQAAETPLYLATSAEVADISGRYFVKRRPAAPAAAAQDAETARRLWEVSAQMVGIATG